MAGHDGAGISSSPVDTNAESIRATIGRDAAIVRNEIVFWVLGRNSALNCAAIKCDRLLWRYAGFSNLPNPASLGDPDLRLDNIETGRNFGNGMLDLNSRIDFDEIERAAIGIEQKFSTVPALTYRASLANRERGLTQSRTCCAVDA